MNMEIPVLKKVDRHREFRELNKLYESKINTEDLIAEIQSKPALWDVTTEAYSDKSEKLSAWCSILRNFISDFEERPASEKNVLVTIAQKKWKSIRTCYNRELQKRKNIKSGSEAINRKRYVYFDQLRFLETRYKKTASSMEEDNNSYDSQDTGAEIDLATCESPTEIETPKNRARKRGKSEDDELTAVSKKKIAAETHSMEEEKDEDKHFLLSLLSEIHKVPPERKLKLRSDIISVIAAAQANGNQQWVPNGVPSMPYPIHYPTQFPPASYYQAPPLQVHPVQQYPSSNIYSPVPHQQTHSSKFLHAQSLKRNCLASSPAPPSPSTESDTCDSPTQ